MFNIKPFKFWCQKILPTEYDDSLSYYELLCKVVNKLNEVTNATNNLSDNFETVKNAMNELYSYVEHYFDNIDVQDEINKKLDEMAESGELSELIERAITNIYVTPEMYGAKGDGVTDDSLSIKQAILTGKPVIFSSKKEYFIGNKIEINGGAFIDFNGCVLKLKAGFKFSAPSYEIKNSNEGSVLTYVGGSTEVNYIIPSYLPQVGIVKINNDEIFYSDSGVTYNLGFSSVYANGTLESAFSATMNNATGYYYPATFVRIKNIGDIIPVGYNDELYNEFKDSPIEKLREIYAEPLPGENKHLIRDVTSYFSAFTIQGCFVEISHCFCENYGGLTLFDVQFSNVNIHDCKIYSAERPVRFKQNPEFSNQASFYYGICIACCSSWVIKNVKGMNAWHTVTTGYNLGVSQNGRIENCTFKAIRSKLYNSKSYSYVEHKNTWRTTIKNSSIESCIMCNGDIYDSSITGYLGLWSAYKDEYKRDTVFRNCSLVLKNNCDIVTSLGSTFGTQEQHYNHYYGLVNFENCHFTFSGNYYLTPFINPNTTYGKIIGRELTFNNCIFSTQDFLLENGTVLSANNRPIIRGRESDTYSGLNYTWTTPQYAIFTRCNILNCGIIRNPFVCGLRPTVVDGAITNYVVTCGNMGGMDIYSNNTHYWRGTSGTFNVAFSNVEIRNGDIYASPILHDRNNSNIVCINCTKRNNAASQQASEYNSLFRSSAPSNGVYSYTVNERNISVAGETITVNEPVIRTLTTVPTKPNY